MCTFWFWFFSCFSFKLNVDSDISDSIHEGRRVEDTRCEAVREKCYDRFYYWLNLKLSIELSVELIAVASISNYVSYRMPSKLLLS